MMTGGSSSDNSAVAMAERPSMSALASGVRVTEACVAAMRLITRTGSSAVGNSAAKPCARAAAAKKRGKMMPPGKPPATASAMAVSLATKIWKQQQFLYGKRHAVASVGLLVASRLPTAKSVAATCGDHLHALPGA